MEFQKMNNLKTELQAKTEKTRRKREEEISRRVSDMSYSVVKCLTRELVKTAKTGRTCYQVDLYKHFRFLQGYVMREIESFKDVPDFNNRVCEGVIDRFYTAGLGVIKSDDPSIFTVTW